MADDIRYYVQACQIKDRDIERLRGALQCLLDNVQTGSFESTCAACDRAYEALRVNQPSTESKRDV